MDTTYPAEVKRTSAGGSARILTITDSYYKASQKWVVGCIREDAAMDLTDEQWAVLEPVLGTMPRREDGRGRPWRESREVLDGILWILRTGAQWHTLPAEYPPYQTCHRRFQRWVARRHVGAGAGGVGPRPEGAWEARPLRVFHRWHVHRRQERGGCVGPTKRGKGTKLMAVADRFGLPLAACAASASPHERTLVAATLDSRFLPDAARSG